MEFATIMTTIAAAVTVIFTVNNSLNKRFDDLRSDNKILKDEIKKLDEKISKVEINLIERMSKIELSLIERISKVELSLIERMSKVEGEMDSIRNMMNTLMTAFLGHKTGTSN